MKILRATSRVVLGSAGNALPISDARRSSWKTKTSTYTYDVEDHF